MQSPRVRKLPRLAGLFFLLLACLQVVPAARGEDGDKVDKVDEGYRLGVGDRIGISVLGERDLSLEVLVNDQGAINYPFLGELQAAGITVEALRERITFGLKPDYLLDPRVTVQVITYRNFFVNGEVQKPGGFPWQPGMTVRKAAALAGGFTQRASRSRLFIIRDADPARVPAQVEIDAPVAPGDIITIDQSFF